MADKKRRVLAPHYMQDFRCIGSACEDSCCRGWRVDIDYNTYRNYQKIRDTELSPLIEKYVKRNRAQNHSDHNYAKINLLEDARCPFLDDQMLCRIQYINGENSLSDVCSTYPRISNIVNEVLEQSATLSCPEAARLALLEEKGMEFDESGEAKEIRIMRDLSIKTDDLKWKNKPQKYLWELRIFTISTLQNRNYRLYQRLIILGMFYQKLQQYVSEELVDKIPELIASYTNIVGDSSLKESISVIPVQYTIQMEMLKELVDSIYLVGVSNRRYLECFTEFLAGVQYTDEATVEEIGERYQKACFDYYEPFMEDNEYILENYLVNYVFRTLFPLKDGKLIFDSYVLMATHYALIKMHLIGMAAFHKKLTNELVIKLIQSFEKTVEHNHQYLKGITDILKNSGFSTMAYMSILIKN